MSRAERITWELVKRLDLRPSATCNQRAYNVIAPVIAQLIGDGEVERASEDAVEIWKRRQESGKG